MALTGNEPVSTGNLKAVLMAMAKDEDGFLGAYATAACSKQDNASAKPTLWSACASGVSFSGTNMTLPAGVYLLSVAVETNGEYLALGDSVLFPGDYVIAGGKSYALNVSPGSQTSFTIVKLGGGLVLDFTPFSLKAVA